jgi:hypothetical protein
VTHLDFSYHMMYGAARVTGSFGNGAHAGDKELATFRASQSRGRASCVLRATHQVRQGEYPTCTNTLQSGKTRLGLVGVLASTC